MTQLIVPKTHVIVTYAKTSHHITAEQNEKLKGIGDKDYVEVDGSSIRGSSIAGIFTLADYYNAHPNERPVATQDFLPPVKIDVKGQHSNKRLLEGLKHYCDANPKNKSAEMELKKRTDKYRRLYPSAPIPGSISCIEAHPGGRQTCSLAL